jgi:signal transduction histidine kinase/ActR/RegA family two-component response regulator
MYPFGILLVATAVVALAIALRATRRRATRAQAVIDAAQAGLGSAVSIVRGDRFVLAYPRFAELTGRPIETLLADVAPSSLVGTERWASPPKGPFETTFVHPDGRRVAVECIVRPLGTGAGENLFIARDVTERQRILSQIMVSDRMTSVGTLAAGVAHEINNPLAYILSNVDSALGDLEAVHQRLLKASVPEPEAYALLEDMNLGLRDAKAGAQRVRDIVRDLRTFSRVDAGPRGPVDLGRVLELTAHMASNEIRHRARLTRDWGDLPAVDGNESLLEQVFLNLLVNAAHAIPEGEVDRNEVRISARRAGDTVVVEVGDTGRGIPPELRGRIFDPFFTTKAPGLGTGLGLWIVHNTVAALGGEVALESTSGSGTTFRITLPASREKVVAPATHSGTPSRRARILVIDDEAPVASAMRRALREHEVVVCRGGPEALQKLAGGERFDVLFCDLMMPEMSGMELYEELAARYPEQAARVVFVTGGAFTPGAQAFLNKVKNPRLDKPFETEDLRAEIHRLLEEKPGLVPAASVA